MASNTRLFIGRLGHGTTERDLEDAFTRFGQISQVTVKGTYGFVEFTDPRDADEAVREMEGYRLNGSRIAVEFSRGPRDREDYRSRRYDDRRRGSRYDDRDYDRDRDRDYDRDRYDDRDRDYRDRDRDYDRDRDRDRDRYGERRGRNPYSRFSPPYNTDNRVVVTDLPPDCSWQDLKDYFRKVGDVCFTDVKRGRGVVEFKTSDAMKEAVRKLDRTKLRGYTISVVEDKNSGSRGGRGGSRSPSPSPRKRARSPSREKSPRDRSPRDRSPRDKSPRDRSPRDRSPREKSPRDKSPRDKSPRDNRSPRDRSPREKSPRDRSGSPSPKRARRSPGSPPPNDRKEDERAAEAHSPTHAQ